ncbi:MAG: threonylcarbamoyl-AMP synthase [Methylococcaceae bacterium]|nr:threonylcarbamoyl-AMP synthase [Methylococcaceae bacterium]
MAQYFQIHPQTPQLRLIRRAVEIVQDGGLIIYPTDSSYAFGCRLDNKDGFERIRRLRQLGNEHKFSLICRDLSQVANFAKFGNDAFRMIKSLTPGPYTFVLPGTREVPRRLLHPKRKSIGFRLPKCPVTQLLVEELGEPLVSSTLILPGETTALADPLDIRDQLEKSVELIIDADVIPYAPSTIIGFLDDGPELIRLGTGPVHNLF